jgi:hypothetical protein
MAMKNKMLDEVEATSARLVLKHNDQPWKVDAQQ